MKKLYIGFLIIITIFSNNVFAEDLNLQNIVLTHMAYENPTMLDKVQSKLFPKFLAEISTYLHYFGSDKDIDMVLKEISVSDYTVKEVAENKRNGFNALVYENADKNECVIVLRGTQLTEKEDLLEDMNAVVFNNISYQLVDAKSLVNKIKNENKQRHITVLGHSFGGYLAQMVAMDMRLKGEKDENMEFITFNAPGVFSVKKFCDSLAYPNSYLKIQVDNSLIYLNKNHLNDVKNYIIRDDFISNFGVHFGNTIYLDSMYKNTNALQKHSILNFYLYCK